MCRMFIEMCVGQPCRRARQLSGWRSEEVVVVLMMEKNKLIDED
jgi:hypothetical protein